MAQQRNTHLGSAARQVGAAAAVVAIAVGIAACGSSSSSSSSTTPSSSASSGGGQTVSLKESEFKFTPPSATAKPGNVTFDVSNDGTTTHSLTVQGPNGSQTLSSSLQPGKSGTLSVDLSKPGKYTFCCPIDSHRQMGMQGTITVGSGGSASASASGGGGGGTSSGGGGGGYSY